MLCHRPVALVATLSVGCAPSTGTLEQAMEVCAAGPTVYGIDVSRFQGEIDWPMVAGSGVVYAWIQISRSLTDIDARFDENWRGARDAGILRGAYQRFQPDEGGAAQAELFLDRLGTLEPDDLPPMLDVEDTGGLGPQAIAAEVRQWLDIVEAATGVTPIIYTGFYFWRDNVAGAGFERYPLWIANYSADCPLVPAPWPRWTLHQYSSSAMIPGITANTVDVNRFNGTLEDLRALSAPPVCGDGVCSASESTSSCLEDCPPCKTIEPAGGVIDDAGECFRVGGDPRFIRQESAGHDGSLQWTHTTDLPEPANHGRWDLHLAEAGRYRVEAYTPAPFSESRRAVYQIRHAGQETAIELDQRAVDGWNQLGELEFHAGGDQSIRVDDNTGEPNDSQTALVFDAIRLTRLDAPSGDDRGDGPRGEDLDGGCSAGGEAGAAAALFVLALLWRLGRRRFRGCMIATHDGRKGSAARDHAGAVRLLLGARGVREGAPRVEPRG